MKSCTDAEKAFIDAAFGRPSGTAKESAQAYQDARLAVMKERLPQEMLDQAVRARADYKKARERDTTMWGKFAELGFEGTFPGARMWKQIDEAADKPLGGETATLDRDHAFDDAMRSPQ